MTKKKEVKQEKKLEEIKTADEAVQAQIEESTDELDQPYSPGSVSVKTELKGAFFGAEDEMIQEYLASFMRPKGATYGDLVLYFVHEYRLMGERRLRKRLQSLIKSNLIVKDKTCSCGLTFYKVNKEE